jgi:hypothetical protein
MEIAAFPFQTLNWSGIEPEVHPGTTGSSSWKIFKMGDIRIRMVEHSAAYSADHWCEKGHIIYCIAGEMITKLQDGREFTLSAGMTYHVGDNSDVHSSRTKDGCHLFIVD